MGTSTIAKGDSYVSDTNGTVTSVSGTTNRVTVATGTTTPVIDISAAYVGQSSITTVGALTSGSIDGMTIGGTTPVSIRGYMPSATTFSGTTGTLALTDGEYFQICSNASTQTLTVPTNASVAFPVNTEIVFFQQGAGQVVFAAAGGVTIQSVSSNLKISAQFGVATLKKTATDNWALFGNLSA